MITILPMQDSEGKVRILEECADAGNDAEVLLMRDAGEKVGYAVVDVNASTLRILNIALWEGSAVCGTGSDEAFYADALLRASASYGMEHGAYQMESRAERFRDFFQSAGFRETPKGFLCNLSNLIKNCTNQVGNP